MLKPHIVLSLVVLLWFVDEQSYRLVEFPLTDDNERAIDGNKRQSSVLKFGKPSRLTGEAEDGDGGESPDFEIRGFEESEIGRK